MATRAKTKPSKAVAARTTAALAARRRTLWAGVALVALTLLAYLPVIGRGGFIWDDDYYVLNNPTLRTAAGLGQIWFSPKSLPQYYPLVHTTYWIEYRLWGLHPTGYHLANVLLHAGSAVLLWLILRRFELPGAWLAAGIFAVHPVHVESVAWITERKNVLSGLLYLLAMWTYLRFVAQRGERLAAEPQATCGNAWRLYALSLALFVCALFSKTVTCSLPAAILLILWWQRGRIARRDAAPLAPFFAIGVALAALTATLEKHHVGAVGAEWNYSFLERCLIAGRALWFYAGKLLWPANLTFIYPHWTIDARQWWQWAYPIAAALLVAALWGLRQRIGRGPLVAALFFGGTLLPALGFFNVYPMRYSFVADHFQYLASLGIITLGAAGLALLGRRLLDGRRFPLVGLAVLLPLVLLAWRQAPIYENAEALWRDTLAKNSSSWMAHTNLGHALAEKGDLPGAMAEYKQAARLAPHLAENQRNLGIAYLRLGRLDDAEAALRQAVALDPSYAPAHYSLGNLLVARRKPAEAMKAYRQALALQSDYGDAHFQLGVILEQEGRIDEAIPAYRAAAALKPFDPDPDYNLGNCLLRQRRVVEAAEAYRKAIELAPQYAEAHANLGAALLMLGRNTEAAESFRTALRLRPGLVPARVGLERALAPSLR